MKLAPWMRLVRLPNLFSAWPDILLAGFVADARMGLPDGAALLGLSTCFYWSGMVQNDLADRARDAAHAPERPIPAGEISPGAAAAFMALLWAGGLVLAFSRSAMCGAVALLLVACMTAYNYGKAWPGAVALVGGCRAAHLALGAAAVGQVGQRMGWLMGASALYIAGVTCLSRVERADWHARAAGAGALGMAAGLVAWGVSLGPSLGHIAALVFVALYPLSGLVRVLRARDSRLVPPLIGRSLRSITLMDAVLAHCFAGLAPAALIAACIVPGTILRKWFYES